MTNTVEKKTCVETLSLAADLDRRVALASIRIGEILVRGVAVWRSPKGSLRVYFPSYKLGGGYEDAIYLPEELRTEVEADVLAAYRKARSEAKKESTQ